MWAEDALERPIPNLLLGGIFRTSKLGCKARLILLLRYAGAPCVAHVVRPVQTSLKCSAFEFDHHEKVPVINLCFPSCARVTCRQHILIVSSTCLIMLQGL